ncbi:flagellar hook-basal body complex protein [Stenotrophomonas maltophilia]|uniref:flagellar hook-basal body protein n=1 Tax=Stenotrophomonas TaxID=40323 RepID=UPI0006C0A2D6|nr:MULTISPECIES: flagellar hook-basal body complex protein [Stenotrophomonas]KAA3601114.1 flagellar hook-basal body complex protein [Stenotrophomonas maltophilia]KOO78077.1 flagellar hook-basal body protein [Stenotrophomonas maltophilia]MBN5125838.1 flagellar hook-basal body complex protein [Stenotrophomonas maltophilia]MBN5176200.1 flagellar hook-basal body complex protein [Stenotrophomonas maltophilia]MCU1120618.1 flagellar hook-basal body complex protein [Stenotrophomonas maltophilia]
MIDALYIAASGLRSEQKQIDVISNNVANMQTPGFKRSRVNFADVAGAAMPPALDATLPAAPAQAMPGGTRISATLAEFETGDIRATGNPLDLAINGSGLFELELDDGSVAYTRDGQFRLDAEGSLRTLQGARLANAPQIPLDATKLEVSSAGEVSVLMPGETQRTVLGAIELAVFGATYALQSVGDNRFTATVAAGSPSYAVPGEAGSGKLQQGYVEMANVQMIEEMSSLVMAQRAYQLNARVLQAADQVLETINNLRR